jgi:hypothetical protein
MKNDFDKEEFLESIHRIPHWVRNGDDLLKFCKHLQYRLFQEKAVNRWYQDNMEKVSEEKYLEVNKIQSDYDKAYNNDLSKFQSFSEFLVEK